VIHGKEAANARRSALNAVTQEAADIQPPRDNQLVLFRPAFDTRISLWRRARLGHCNKASGVPMRWIHLRRHPLPPLPACHQGLCARLRRATERVGVRGALQTLRQWKGPLTRIAQTRAPTSPRKRGEVRCRADLSGICSGSKHPTSGAAPMTLRSPSCQVSLLAVTLLFSGAASAYAQGGAMRHSEFTFLGELVMLMAVGRLLGEAMHRIGQPSVMGQLIGGILLGPSVLGWLWPDLQHAVFPGAKEQRAMVDAISQLGILLLLLLTGMEIDLGLVRKFSRAAISISLAGVAVPLACGAALGAFLPTSLLPSGDKRLVTALFLGTALSISSIKIVAAIVREMNFARRNLGQVMVSSAIMEDTMGWIIIAVTLSLAQAGDVSLVGAAKTIIGTAVFLVASFTFGRRMVFYAIRWANDNFESEFPVITAILVIMGVMALATQLIGVNTVLGAFVAGVLIGQSPILTRHIDEQLRGLIVAFFMPVFFGMAGLEADFTILKDPRLLLMTFGLIAIASIGKFAGAFIGGEIGGLTRREALALAFAMNARGSTEVIVASIGLSMGALTQNLFTMIVAMAVATTMAMPPMLRWGLSRVPMRESEKERLEREEKDARGFVSNLERLLLAVDHSPNGRFASRLAGLIAGARQLPITVLPMMQHPVTSGRRTTAGHMVGSDQTNVETAAKEIVEDSVKAAAADTQRQEDDAAPPDVTLLDVAPSSEEAVEKEARKGYSLLFIGLDHPRTQAGEFHSDIARIASRFDGPKAIVATNGIHLKEPEASRIRLLVPVNGTETSRRAAEVAIALARVLEAHISALYVSNVKADVAATSYLKLNRRGHEQAILNDIVELAEQYGHKIETAVRTNVAPEDAILAEARQRGSDLIVMGVSVRPGKKLFFGDTAAAVLEKAPNSVLFLST
jgi:Kef-type K+ transport system membrane component KefB/nucleotide-binding universal stress UspA family protein